MAVDTFASIIAEHWVLILLALCPVAIVTMALAALNCEACGAPFGIFRRRNRTIDLCVRCALVHDIRHAKETRDASSSDRLDPKPDSSAEPAASSTSGSQSMREGRQEERRADTGKNSRLSVR